MSNTLCPQISQWMLFASELRSTYIAVITANVICSCVAMLGNAIMVAAILRNSSLRRTPSFMLLCTLAISDLGVGIICQPLFITLRVTETLDDKELSCKIGIAYSSTVGCLVILSFLTITAISFDRFLAVLLKLNYRGVVTVKRVKVVILLLWLASVLSGMTYVLHIPTYFYLVMVVLSTCLIFAAFNYLAIAWKLYGQSARLQLHHTSLDGEKTVHIVQPRPVQENLEEHAIHLHCISPVLPSVLVFYHRPEVNRSHKHRSRGLPCCSNVGAGQQRS